MDSEVGVFSADYDSEYVDFSLIKLLTASAAADIEWSDTLAAEASAIASVANVGVEVNIPIFGGNISITWDQYWVAAGVGAEFDITEGKVKITPPSLGIVSSWGIDFDF